MDTPSLEEDILALFWESEKPLSLKAIHQKLKAQRIVVPIKTIQKILETFEQAELIKTTHGFGWSKHYTAMITERELNLASSEHLLVRCLKTKPGVLFKHFHANLIEKITHLQWFTRKPER